MRIFLRLPKRISLPPASQCVMLAASLVATTSFSLAQASAPGQTSGARAQASHHHHRTKKQQTPEPVAQAPAPPPMPHWPVNDQPNPASVVWDANGLRINASNSSLQQILSEVSTETGTKVEGPVPDQRVYGDYGPGQARDVLSQLLQGSGYNILLAGDLGKGAPREIVLSPRQENAPNQNGNANRPQQDPDEEIPEQPEDQPQPPIPPSQQQMQNMRPGFGPNGPIRTPQQVMEEMQQRQQQQQQQMQQQMQQQNPQ